MKKRLISTLVCAAVLAAYAVMPVSANSLSYSDVTFDESAWDTADFNNNVKITYDDGTTVEITNSTGTDVAIKSGDNGKVVGNAANNEYIQLDTLDVNVNTNLTITPATALTEDFIIEFDYAAEVSATDEYKAFFAEAYPSGRKGTEAYKTVFYALRSGKTGSHLWPKSAEGKTWDNPKIPGGDYNVNTPDSDTDYFKVGSYRDGDNGFDKIKIHTKFNSENVSPTYKVVYPTFDVYLNDTLMASDVQYNTKQYCSYANGIAHLNFQIRGLSNGAKWVAFDNIKIYDAAVPKYNGTFDFEARQYSAIERAANSGITTNTVMEFHDGTKIVTQGSTDRGTSKISVTDSGIVTNNTSGNKYLQVEFKGEDSQASNYSPGYIAFIPKTTMTKDFAIDFKMAVDCDFPAPGYTVPGKTTYWPAIAYSMKLNVFPGDLSVDSISGTTYDARSSALMAFSGAKDYYHISTPNAYGSVTQENDSSVNYVSTGSFEDVRLIFTNVTSEQPECSIYRKQAGSDYYELIAEGVKFLADSNINSTYKDKGLNAIKLWFFDADTYLNSDYTIKFAFDDIKFTPLSDLYKDEIDFSQVSAKLEGGKYYPQVTATSYFEETKTVQVITAVYDANGMMTGKEIKPLTLTKGDATSVQSEGVTAAAGGYARVYVVDSLATLNNVVDYYTTE